MHGRLGACRVATSEDAGVLRIRRRGRLKRLWATDATGAFLAWETEAPWPWAMQSLYIPGPMSGSDLNPHLEDLLPGWIHARELRHTARVTNEPEE